MMYVIGLLAVLIKLIGIINCGGILDLAFVKFIHHDLELHCDEPECDFKYVICLDAANGNYLDIEDCFYRRLEEYELPEVAINFNHWPGALLLKVAIFDRRASNDVLVDSLHALLEAEPGQGKQIEMRSQTTLTVNFTVQCDKDYYGPLCSTFCVPLDNKIGHYSCDAATGTLVCHAGWKGRFCSDKVLEPDKIPDMDDNAISSSEDMHLEDSTTVESAERVTSKPPLATQSIEATDYTTFTVGVPTDSSNSESMSTNSTLSPHANFTEEKLVEGLEYLEENLTTMDEELSNTELPIPPSVTDADSILPAASSSSLSHNKANIDFLTLLLDPIENEMNALYEESRLSHDRGMEVPHEKTESESSTHPSSEKKVLPESESNLGVFLTIVEALLEDPKNTLSNKNESARPNELEYTQENTTEIVDSIATATTSTVYYEEESTTILQSTAPYTQNTIPASSTEMFSETSMQASQRLTTEKVQLVINNSVMPTNLLEEALLEKKPPIAADDASTFKKSRYYGVDNSTNRVRQILLLEEINYNARGKDNNKTELTFVYSMTENPLLLNGSAGNLETVVRDVLRHEVGDETSDRLGIHFEIVDGHLKYAIYAKNGSLPPHMAEQVFKLRPHIESAFVHLASTHHEAPSATIPHKRRGIPEWGILTVIVGIVFIAIITMRQAQKYCGRTHKALKPQELHEEKDAESMPTTSAANFMNPAYNST